MATSRDMKMHKLEKIIGHTFVLKRLVYLACTSAGADPSNYDGNRRLSQLGASLVDSVLAIIVFLVDGSRECTANLRKGFLDKKNYHFVAKRAGIDECIEYNERTDPNSPEVFRKAINAIIAAVFLDTWSIKTTIIVILRIFSRPSDDRIFGELPAIPIDTIEALSSVPRIILAQESGVIDPSILLSNESFERSSISPMLHRLLEHQVETTAPIVTEATDNMTDKFNISDFLRDDLLLMEDENHANGFENDAEIELTPAIDGHSTTSLMQGGTPVTHRRRGLSSDDESITVAHLPKRGRKAKSTKFSVLQSQEAEEILSKERENCALHNVQPPEKVYFSPSIVNRACKLEKETLGGLVMILITIAGPRSVIALRETIICERVEKTIDSFHLAQNITKRQRYDLIKRLGQKKILFQLLRWYHVLDLFEQCGGTRTQSSTGFVNKTSADFVRPERRPGNPGKRADSQVVQAMKESLMELNHSSRVSDNERTIFMRYWKLGQRLYMLTNKFGRWILGLMVAPAMNIEVTDNMLINPKDEIFRDFVNLLEESQGQWLRTCGDAASHLLCPLLESRLDETRIFQLESMEPRDIMSQPKCSEALFRTIA
ncbi:hypothetical protein BO86DRAFT_419751 [Aspergillus japonicus CBS 114.51]|uniref:RNase III domain-containing protein n=1 Tax=Aspergillus japonicus CBS 114.51 TaxID=1448312 RepID=A0A8T8WYW2_ASPJA|nr:hypothetical protein BO86DRAFT_419751 [Aspergillus japonicus CBS 114.51]RAH80830.1 hypothetical protein BO86DRAFT_419751 [Aspergillus japonicus CBS 114.51]